LLANFSDELERNNLDDIAEGIQLRNVGKDEGDGARRGALDKHVQSIAASAVVSLDLSSC
jgi:hypothetical protein